MHISQAEKILSEIQASNQLRQNANKYWIKVWSSQYFKNKIPNIDFTK